MDIVYQYTGIIDAKSGWKYLPSEEGKMTYIPFEGIYESKGGRIESPRFSLDKEKDQATFYLLSFSSQAAVQGYWWVDFFDKDGNPLPDINSAFYPSEQPMVQDAVLFATPEAVTATIAFVFKSGITVRDVQLKKITREYAAEWCDKLFATLPKADFPVPHDAFDLLPKTKAALNNGSLWRIVMLGDSIVNDTWCSNFQALVMRDFPRANLDFHISMRGCTGAWFYCEKNNFSEYVARYKPDLVMIGGISNPGENENVTDPEIPLRSLILQCRELGAEVVVMSPPPSKKWRKGVEPEMWSENWLHPDGSTPLRSDFERKATAVTQTAFWDITTVPCNILSTCPQESSWFSRDRTHNNDRGKQLIGRTLAACFRAAKEE